MSSLLPPPNLPGVNFNAGQLEIMLLAAPKPEDTWLDFLTAIHPQGLAEVPIWYVTVVQNAVKAGHITTAQEAGLLTADESVTPPAPPVHLMTAWGSLTQAMAVTWPKRRKASADAVLRMNTAVARARKAALRG